MPKVSNKTRCRGTAVVETAIVVPLLLTLTLAIIEYGWLFLKAQQITNATRQAARVGIAWGANATDVDNAILYLMTSADMAGKYSVTYTPGVQAGDLVIVTVSVPSKDIALVNIPFLPKPTNISASVTMAKEGP